MSSRETSRIRVQYVPVLHTLRELYLQPRTMQRFRQYVAALTGGTDDVVLPIGIANPMARQHASLKIDQLQALGVDEIALRASADAEARLASLQVDVTIKTTVVLADDVGGGWTNRYTSEASARFPTRGALKRPFALMLAWTSESPTAETVRAEMLAAIYRVAYQQVHGLGHTLATMLNQEGLAGLFADAPVSLTRAEVEAARTIIAALGADPPYPAVFAAMYGDAAAAELGYRPLGLPPRAGFGVALADARAAGRDPIAALRAPSSAREQLRADARRARGASARQAPTTHRGPRVPRPKPDRAW